MSDRFEAEARRTALDDRLAEWGAWTDVIEFLVEERSASSDAWLLVLEAQARIEQGADVPAAIALLESCDDPDAREVTLELLARAFGHLGDDAALAGVLLEELDALGPGVERAEHLLRLRSVYLAADDKQAATLVAERAFEEAPELEAAQVALLAAAEGDVASLRGAIERSTDAPAAALVPIRRALAAVFAARGDALQAEAQYDLILEAAPADHEALTFLVSVWTQAGEHGAVRSARSRAFEAAPDDAGHLDAYLALLDNDPASAAAALDRHRGAREIEDGARLRQEAELRAQIGEHALATALWKRAAEVLGNAEPLLALAEHLAARERPREAAEALTEAARADTAHAERAARAWRDAGDLERAWELVPDAPSPLRLELARSRGDHALLLDTLVSLGDARGGEAGVPLWTEAAGLEGASEALRAELASRIAAAREDDASAWKAAADAHRRTGDIARASDALQRVTALTEGAARAEAFSEQADLAERSGEDPVPLLEEALRADATRYDVATRLATLYLEREEWAHARELLEHLIALGPRVGAPDVQSQLRRFLGDTLRRLGLTFEAMDALAESVRVAPDDAARCLGLRALASLCAQSERPGPLAQLADHLALLDDASEAATHHIVGRAYGAAGDADRALASFQRALERDPEHGPSLREIAARGSDDPNVLRSVLRHATHAEERVPLLLRLADVHAAAGEYEDAAAALELAREHHPGSSSVLRRLLALHQAFSRWEPACAVLARLAELESEPVKRSRYLLTIGALQRDELEQPGAAASTFERALDADPDSEVAWSAYRELLVRLARHEEHERAIRARLHRQPDAEDVADLLLELGDLYRDALDRADDAREAYTVARLRRPHHLPTLERLARTYPPGGKADEVLAQEHHDILHVAPRATDSHYLLFQAYRRTRAFDRAWLACAALHVLGDHVAPAERFYEEHRPSQLKAARRKLTLDDWRALDADLLVDHERAFLTALGQSATPILSGDLRRLGIHPRKDLRTTGQLGALGQLVHYAAFVIDVEVAQLYAVDTLVGLRPVASAPVRLARGSDLVDAIPDRRTSWRVVRATTLLRPECSAVALVAHPDGMRAITAACISLAHPPSELDEPALQWRDALLRLPETHLGALQHAAAAFVAAGGSATDAPRWPAAVELRARRAATLLTGDLLRSLEGLAAIPHPIASLDGDASQDDLLRFWGSGEHAHLRAGLGIGIGQ